MKSAMNASKRSRSGWLGSAAISPRVRATAATILRVASASRDLVQAHVAQRLDLARDGLGDLLLHLVVSTHAGDLREHLVQQGLVAAARGQGVQRLAGEPRDIDRASPAAAMRPRKSRTRASSKALNP